MQSSLGAAQQQTLQQASPGVAQQLPLQLQQQALPGAAQELGHVSYTHLTLPTSYSV